jgi:hypothetical protein
VFRRFDERIDLLESLVNQHDAVAISSGALHAMGETAIRDG